MTAELLRQVGALNPIPGDAAIPEGMLPAAAILQEIDERTTTMQTKERPLTEAPATARRPRGVWVAVAAFVAVLVLGAAIALLPGGDTTPPITTLAPTTTTQATTTTAVIAPSPEARLDAFFDAIAASDAEAAAEIAGSVSAAEWLIASGWVASAGQCGPEVPDSNEFFACEVTTDVAVADRVGDTTLTFTYEYNEQADEFTEWQIAGSQLAFEYRYYGSVYDAEAYAASCPDPDFTSGPGRTAECGAYLASIDQLAATVQPAIEPVDAGVARINDVADGENVVLPPGESRFDRVQRIFSLFVGDSDVVTVAGSNLSSTTLQTEDGTTIEIVSPLLYAAPGAPLGATEVAAPIPLVAVGGFAQWLDSVGMATIVDQGDVVLGAVTAQFYDIEWTQTGAIMRLSARPQGDMLVTAGTTQRVYIVDHPDGLPLVVFVAPGAGGPEAANVSVEALLNGIELRTTPVYP